MTNVHNVHYLSPTPCLTCGACCVTLRASFHWLELASAGGTVPDEYTVPLSSHCVAMQGTVQKPMRCCALEGTVGEHVSCRIYPLRSSTCREFRYSGQDGLYDERCEAARARCGLPPLMLPPNQPLEDPPELPVAI